MDYTEKKLDGRDIFRGRVVYLHVDDVELSNGDRSTREVVEHPGGVTVIPVDENGDVWCVRQYRYPFGLHLLETPAGKLEPWEDPLECAVRELSEETGFEAEQFISLGCMYPSPGYCRETLYIYLALGLKPGPAHLDPDEFLDVEKHSLSELLDMAMRDELRDAKTVLAVMKAKLWLDGRR